MTKVRMAALIAATAAISAATVTPAWAAEQQAYAAGLMYATPVIAAAPGDTLRFNNEDPIAQHNIVSDTPGLFAGPLVSDGDSALVSGVEKLAPGTYQFHCTLHAWMHGAIEVAAGAGTPQPPAVPDPNDPPNPVDLLPHAAPAPLSGGDWPFYGNDLTNSRDGGVHGPAVTDVPFLRPVWSVKATDGDFTGTPVESGGTLVAVSGGGTVFAIDASTGKVLWTHDVATAGGELVNGTAAIADGRVFVPISRANGPELAALSLADGSPLWEVSYDPQTGADTFGSPVVWGGKVYIGTAGQNGDPDVPLRGSVTALDVATGAQVWQTHTVPEGDNGGPVWTTPAIDTDTGTLFVGTGNAYSGKAADTTDSVVAFDATTGELLRHFQATAGDVFTTTTGGAAGPDADFGASPQLITGPNGQKLLGDGQKSGTYWALDRATLQPVWSTMTGPGSALGGIIGSTAYDGTRIYGPDTPGGEQWALGLDGTPAWFSSDGGPLHFSSTSVANGVVYTTDMTSVLTAREAATGAVLAKLPLGAPSWGGVAVAGGYVFAVTGTQGASGYVVGYRADK
jgi:polyvinyl alcohol dehydrogenase (cytochrome)